MTVLDIPALALSQSPGKTIYAFGVDAKSIPTFASVSRVSRDEDGRLLGYQRPEVRKHIAEIRAYVESEEPMVPNALVLAFDSRVRFEPTGSSADGASTHGVLKVPVDPEDKVGWIVDGQQRIAAIREARVETFPMFAIGFVAESDSEAREQFMLVNSTKPLPKNLIYELLPGVDARMPSHLDKRKLPASILEVLNHREDSPLYQAISTATNPGAKIKDNSILRFLENSLSDGVLYRIRLLETDQAQTVMQQVLFGYWSAVRRTWPELWDLKPRQSRLLHGAGVVTLGFLMDAISDGFRDRWPTEEDFTTHLAGIKPHCRWNEGYWDFGGDVKRRWDDVQNTSQDVNLLANHLTRQYQRWVRDQANT
ncbi:MAG: DGQHR domain-containing protein [Deltaproteobacteria bacterium]|nr:MAG: DGQHR domain-containing protein [Deltaproteobacteria bacterium]